MGTYPFADKDEFYFISWDGPEEITYYNYSNTAEKNNSEEDFLFINGDFSIDYVIPRILPGSYRMSIKAEAYFSRNAMIEVYLDGNKIGSNLNLTTGGDSDEPFNSFELGIVEFTVYEEHTVSIRSLISGEFKWDFVSFNPIPGT